MKRLIKNIAYILIGVLIGAAVVGTLIMQNARVTHAGNEYEVEVFGQVFIYE